MPDQAPQTAQVTATIHHGALTYKSANSPAHPALAAYTKLKTDLKSDPKTVMKTLDAYYHPYWTFTSPSGETIGSPQGFFAEFIGPIIGNFERYESKTEWIITYANPSSSSSTPRERRSWELIECTTNVFGFDSKSSETGSFVDRESVRWDFGLPAMYSFTFVDDEDGKGVRMIRQSMVMDMGELNRLIAERKE